MFDWSFEIPRLDEISVVDQEICLEAERYFLPRVNLLGYILEEPLASTWNKIKIVRIDIYDPTTARVIGKAIRLDNGKEISYAMQIVSDS